VTDKEKLVAKFGLILENGKWYSKKENAHPHLIFTDKYFQKTDLLGLVCRINKLCFAKVKYFRQNIDRFEPLKYDMENGFIKTGLWDVNFFRHKASGLIIDLRYLQTITVYEDFVKLCEKLDIDGITKPLCESHEKNYR